MIVIRFECDACGATSSRAFSRHKDAIEWKPDGWQVWGERNWCPASVTKMYANAKSQPAP